MRTNTLKRKLNNGEATIGAFVNSPSPAMVEIMGWLGFDFAIIDCEHCPMDYETTENMIRAAELSDITPIVRIGMNIQQHIQRYMDAGAAGVLMPLINTGAEARAVVDAVKYPPVGKRGLFGGRGSMNGLQDIAEYVKEANRETFIAIQIETLEAIENQDEIINTEHADLIFLGPGDLSSRVRRTRPDAPSESRRDHRGVDAEDPGRRQARWIDRPGRRSCAPLERDRHQMARKRHEPVLLRRQQGLP